MDYEGATRSAYRSRERASSYKRYHTTEWSWGRIATYLEQSAIRRLLSSRAWTAADLILDAPCGTGILGATLARSRAQVIASDISLEMMALADGEYSREHLRGFVQADITTVPFADKTFAGVITLGFMHRVPHHVRKTALSEIARVCSSTAIISFSLRSQTQLLKQHLLRFLTSRYTGAPCAIDRKQAEAEIRDAGFTIVRRVAVAPLLSAESLYLLKAGSNSSTVKGLSAE
jgi:ubiquinone/menaquinone biosynthesis C-methylase UbiE